MARTTTGNEDTALAAEVLRPVNLLSLDMPSGKLRVTDAPFSLFFDDDADAIDDEYLGVGDLGSVEAIEETADGKSHRIVATLSGVKASTVSAVITDAWRWRAAVLYRGYLDADLTFVETPRVRFKGWMSSMPFNLGNQNTPPSISVEIVSRFARWEHAYDNPRWSNADHQKRRPGDKFFEFLSQIVAGKEVFWGSSRPPV